MGIFPKFLNICLFFAGDSPSRQSWGFIGTIPFLIVAVYGIKPFGIKEKEARVSSEADLLLITT